VWYIDITEGSKAMLGYTEQSNLALEPSVMSTNMAKDPLVMPHYVSVLLIIRPKKPVMTNLSPCSP
jgi:hypothetical protein